MPRRVIGVDLGGTSVIVGEVDANLAVHHRVQRPVVGLDQPALLITVQEAVEEVISAAKSEIAAVGFGVPSLIDQRTGTSIVAVNLPLDHLPFAAVMSERLGLPVFVDNDANVAALAEHRAGAAQGAREVVVLTIGTGIGGGLILGNQLYRGSVGSGAEMGHMVIDLDGPPCQGNCPNHGCLETMASGTALAREAARIAAERHDSALAAAAAEGRDLVGPLVTELAHDGDPAALEVLRLIGTNLGVGIASLVNIFNPEVVVIGGGVLGAGELLLAPAREEVARRALPPSKDVVRILAAHFGAEAGMIGAAALAFDGLTARPGTRSEAA